MIVGIGNDIVQIRRIELSIQRWGNKFLNRIFSETEMSIASQMSKEKQVAYYAKRFAAKEAFSKALGTGMGRLSSWHEIEVLNDEYGAPVMKVFGDTAETVRQKAGPTAQIHVSLSDDNFAVATVIIEKR